MRKYVKSSSSSAAAVRWHKSVYIHIYIEAYNIITCTRVYYINYRLAFMIIIIIIIAPGDDYDDDFARADCSINSYPVS